MKGDESGGGMRWDGKRCNIILGEYLHTRKIGMEYPTRRVVFVLFVSVEDTHHFDAEVPVYVCNASCTACPLSVG